MRNFSARSICTVLSVALIASEGVAQNRTWREDVSGWYIGIDTSIEDGCFMFASFVDGGVLRTGFDPTKGELYLIVGRENWRSLEEGKLYPIEIIFGNRPPWTADASVFVWNDGDLALLASVPLGDERAENLIGEIQQMSNVRIRYQGKEIINLSLRGSYAAMQQVIECQAANLNRSDNSDPFAPNRNRDADPFQ